MQRALDVAVPAGLDACHALLSYEGAARHLVTGLKYRNDRRALAWLADGMAALLTPPAGTVVTWAPTTAARRRHRGFDQAELLARAVARRWRVPSRDLLHRRSGPPQTGRNRDERLTRVDVVTTRGARRITRPVVVVDDIMTTGATLQRAAAALRGAGAPWVGALTAARTP